MKRRVFDLQHEEPLLAGPDYRLLNKIRNVLLVAWVVVLFIALVFVVSGTFASSAGAHGLDCQEARNRAHHPNAYCNKTSENHVWLYFPWRSCQEHVYWSHGGFWNLEHYGSVVHCPSWH